MMAVILDKLKNDNDKRECIVGNIDCYPNIPLDTFGYFDKQLLHIKNMINELGLRIEKLESLIKEQSK